MIPGEMKVAAGDIELNKGRKTVPVEVTNSGDRPVLEAVNNTRSIGKKDMVHNSWLPEIRVDTETYEVRADGELLVCEPATVLPMAQRYFLF